MRPRLVLLLNAALLLQITPARAVDYGWPAINGSERFRATVGSALVLLATDDLDDFKTVVQHIKRIDEAAHVSIDAITCNETISDTVAFWQYDNQVFLAAYPVHEVYVCLYYQRTARAAPALAEKYGLQHMRVALVRLHAPAYLLSYVDSMIASGPKYQDIPQSRRWW